MPLSKLLSIPFAIATLVLLYLSWKVDSSWSMWLIGAFLPLALLYIMSAEIDWWWYERYPPDLEAPMAELLEKGLPFYQKLDRGDKLRFRNKVAMFIIGNAWEPQVWEEVPRDVQVAIAAQAVIPLFEKKEWLYPKFETIVVHPKGFMSPSFPYTHFSELYEPDQCVLFSAEHCLAPMILRDGAPLIGLYEYAKIAFTTGLLTGWETNEPTPRQLELLRLSTGIYDIHAKAAAYTFAHS
jgi:hypothetical protein